MGESVQIEGWIAECVGGGGELERGGGGLGSEGEGWREVGGGGMDWTLARSSLPWLARAPLSLSCLVWDAMGFCRVMSCLMVLGCASLVVFHLHVFVFSLSLSANDRIP